MKISIPTLITISAASMMVSPVVASPTTTMAEIKTHSSPHTAAQPRPSTPGALIRAGMIGSVAGAGVGAATGAIIGAAQHHDKDEIESEAFKGLAIGAGVGAMAGVAGQTSLNRMRQPMEQPASLERAVDMPISTVSSDQSINLVKALPTRPSDLVVDHTSEPTGRLARTHISGGASDQTFDRITPFRPSRPSDHVAGPSSEPIDRTAIAAKGRSASATSSFASDASTIKGNIESSVSQTPNN